MPYTPIVPCVSNEGVSRDSRHIPPGFREPPHLTPLRARTQLPADPVKWHTDNQVLPFLGLLRTRDNASG